jgi:hypothetical protein
MEKVVVVVVVDDDALVPRTMKHWSKKNAVSDETTNHGCWNETWISTMTTTTTTATTTRNRSVAPLFAIQDLTWFDSVGVATLSLFSKNGGTLLENQF